jgi:hypothetical protein
VQAGGKQNNPPAGNPGYIPKVGALHNHFYENLKSYKLLSRLPTDATTGFTSLHTYQNVQ